MNLWILSMLDSSFSVQHLLTARLQRRPVFRPYFISPIPSAPLPSHEVFGSVQLKPRHAPLVRPTLPSITPSLASHDSVASSFEAWKLLEHLRSADRFNIDSR